MSRVVLKVTYQSDIRRVEFDSAYITYRDVAASIESVYPNLEDYCARYFDEDGDTCLLSESTFPNFMDVSLAASCDDKVLMKLDLVELPKAAVSASGLSQKLFQLPVFHALAPKTSAQSRQPDIRDASQSALTRHHPKATAHRRLNGGARNGGAMMNSAIPSSDFKLGIAFTGLGFLILAAPALVGGFILLLGILFVVQTLRVRFVFDDEAFEVKAKAFDNLFSDDSDLVDSGENFAVGGENRWKYDSFVNWGFLPSEDLPILVYFKETATPEDKWNIGPGKWANSPAALAKGAVPGQVHFFPCIAKAQELKEQFMKRGCARILPTA